MLIPSRRAGGGSLDKKRGYAGRTRKKIIHKIFLNSHKKIYILDFEFEYDQKRILKIVLKLMIASYIILLQPEMHRGIQHRGEGEMLKFVREKSRAGVSSIKRINPVSHFVKKRLLFSNIFLRKKLVF